MIKQLLLFVSLLLFTNIIFADSGIFESYIILNNGTNQYYDAQADTGNPDFNGANLGSFTIGSSYLLNGGEIKTYKNSGSDVYGASLYYRIYETGTTAPSFVGINLPYDSELGNDDQKWTNTAAEINFLSGLTAGNYTLEIYFQATSSDGDHYSNNGGSNYKATFTILQKELNITPTVALTETNLDNGELLLELVNETFEDATLDISNFTLLNAPTGTTIELINYVSTTSATLYLAFNNTDFDTDITNFGLSIAASELSGTSLLSKENTVITAVVEDEVTLNGIVTITPAFPTRSEQVTITLDATGTALETATKIYYHSGVGTDVPDSYQFSKAIGNWGTDDGVGEMTQIGTSNEWEITLSSIETYYALATNDDAFALNFLFRNASGTANEDNNGANYHLAINPENYFLITNPTYNPYLVETNQPFNITGEANISADWTLKELDENGDFITDLNTSTTQNYTFNHSISDVDITHFYQLSVDFGTETKTKNFEVSAYGTVQTTTLPTNAKKGINYNFPNTNEVTFVLHTPTNTTYKYFDSNNCSTTSTATTASKNIVHLIGDFNNWETSSAYQLNKDGDYWWITLNTTTLLPVQDEYVFQYL